MCPPRLPLLRTPCCYKSVLQNYEVNLIYKPKIYELYNLKPKS